MQRLCKCGCGAALPNGAASQQQYLPKHNAGAWLYARQKEKLGKRCKCGATISPTGNQCKDCQSAAIRYPVRYCDCGAKLDISNITGTCKNCLRGPKHHMWQGGTTIHRGYRWIKQPDGTSKSEHRMVWEAAHGPLPPGRRWHVHHKNHDKLDNRLENLELLTVSEHATHHHAERRKSRK